MSQRLPASRPASRSPPDRQRTALPPVQARDDSQYALRQPEGQRPGPGDRGGLPQLQALPPHGQVTRLSQSGEDPRSVARWRDLGVHSMLNPPESTTNVPSPRPFDSAIGVPPMSTAAAAFPYSVAAPPALQHTFLGQYSPSIEPSNAEGYGGTFPRVPPRRILTPRSPSRTVSSSRGRVSGTIDAQKSPFLPSRRGYTSVPGESASADVAPRPKPPTPGQVAQQTLYDFPPPASAPSMGLRRSSTQGPGRTPLSQSASPSISASSYNQSPSQPSPASFLHGGPPSTSAGSYYPGSSLFGSALPPGGGLQFQGPSGTPEGPYSAPATQSEGSSFHSSSAGSSRQASASDPIQVLTITTSQGSYSVPVDVHQASRLADEKRARNAGASARFRQRRKEKEIKSNVEIEKLQSDARDLARQLREVQSERDFYRGERDRYRDVVLRTPDVRHLAMQGPPSPGRATPFQGSMTQMGGPPPPPPAPSHLGFQAPPDSPERAPRRRRSNIGGNFTSISLPYNGPPASSSPPVPTTYSMPHGQPTNLPLPPLRIAPTTHPTTAPPHGSVTPTTGPPGSVDPHARGTYDHRWPGDGARRS